LARFARDRDRETIRIAAVFGIGRVAAAAAEQFGGTCPYLGKIAPAFTRALRDESAGVRIAAAASLARLCSSSDAVAPHLGALIPELAEVAAGDRSKDARYYADRALRFALRVEDSEDGLVYAHAQLRAGGGAHAARARLSDVVLRRLKGLSAEEEPDAGRGGWRSLAADADDDDDVIGDDP
jgi:hypothetical protein